MTQEEKARAYDEVVVRINKAVSDGFVSENFGRDMLGIAESEDEKIRKSLLTYIKGESKRLYIKEWIAYLEKQKEQKPASGNSEKPNNQWSEDFEENIRNLLDDKLTWHSEDGSMSSTVLIDDKTLKDIVQGIWFYVGKEALKYPNKELNVTGWSEEDEENISTIIEVIRGRVGLSEKRKQYYENFLKSLCPQPSRNLAASFMDYLDEHRPEGKMCLSNGECTDIETAFKENDWAKVIRYVNKYQPHWKPSDQEKGALRTAISVLTEERNFPKAAGHLQAILDAFEGKESRKDWKPSEEQMKSLLYAEGHLRQYECGGIAKDIAKLYDDLKKL